MAIGTCLGCRRYFDEISIIEGIRVCKKCEKKLDEIKKVNYIDSNVPGEDEFRESWQKVVKDVLKDSSQAKRRAILKWDVKNIKVKTLVDYRGEHDGSSDYWKQVVNSSQIWGIRKKQMAARKNAKWLDIEDKLQVHQKRLSEK